MDVHTLFNKEILNEEVYMEIPQGFSSPREYKDLKSLYGLKQVSRQWNPMFTETLLQVGFNQSKNDYSLCTKRNGDKLLILWYMWMIDAIKDFKGYLRSKLCIKDLGPLKISRDLK